MSDCQWPHVTLCFYSIILDSSMTSELVTPVTPVCLPRFLVSPLTTPLSLLPGPPSSVSCLLHRRLNTPAYSLPENIASNRHLQIVKGSYPKQYTEYINWELWPPSCLRSDRNEFLSCMIIGLFKILWLIKKMRMIFGCCSAWQENGGTPNWNHSMLTTLWLQYI